MLYILFILLLIRTRELLLSIKPGWILLLDLNLENLAQE